MTRKVGWCMYVCMHVSMVVGLYTVYAQCTGAIKCLRINCEWMEHMMCWCAKLNSLSVIKILSLEEDLHSLERRLKKTEQQSSAKVKGGCLMWPTGTQYRLKYLYISWYFRQSLWCWRMKWMGHTKWTFALLTVCCLLVPPKCWDFNSMIHCLKGEWECELYQFLSLTYTA